VLAVAERGVLRFEMDASRFSALSAVGQGGFGLAVGMSYARNVGGSMDAFPPHR